MDEEATSENADGRRRRQQQKPLARRRAAKHCPSKLLTSKPIRPALPSDQINSGKDKVVHRNYYLCMVHVMDELVICTYVRSWIVSVCCCRRLSLPFVVVLQRLLQIRKVKEKQSQARDTVVKVVIIETRRARDARRPGWSIRSKKVVWILLTFDWLTSFHGELVCSSGG